MPGRGWGLNWLEFVPGLAVRVWLGWTVTWGLGWIWGLTCEAVAIGPAPAPALPLAPTSTPISPQRSLQLNPNPYSKHKPQLNIQTEPQP